MGQKNYADCISNLSQLGDKWGTCSRTLHTDATLTYANTNETALEATPTTLEYYKDIVLEIKVTSLANTTGQTLTIKAATSDYLVTGAEAIAAFESGYWTSKAITLNAGVDTLYYKLAIAANEICGKYLYTSTTYSADPTGDPKVEVKLNLI